MLVLPHTPLVEPSRCDVWLADSESSTSSILGFVALVHSSRSSCSVCVALGGAGVQFVRCSTAL